MACCHLFTSVKNYNVENKTQTQQLGLSCDQYQQNNNFQFHRNKALEFIYPPNHSARIYTLPIMRLSMSMFNVHYFTKQDGQHLSAKYLNFLGNDE